MWHGPNRTIQQLFESQLIGFRLQSLIFEHWWRWRHVEHIRDTKPLNLRLQHSSETARISRPKIARLTFIRHAIIGPCIVLAASTTIPVKLSWHNIRISCSGGNM